MSIVMSNMATQMTIPEAAIALGISIKTVRRWIDNGKLNAEKIDGRWIVDILDPSGQSDDQSVTPDDQSELVAALQQQIEDLRAEVQVKNEQLSRRDDQIESLTTALDHAQQLAAMSQKQSAALTERVEALEDLRARPWWKRWFSG